MTANKTKQVKNKIKMQTYTIDVHYEDGHTYTLRESAPIDTDLIAKYFLLGGKVSSITVTGEDEQ